MDTGTQDTGDPVPALTHLDVLAVVDNTRSMGDEQARLGAALVQWDPGVPWTLHVVTTDSYQGQAYTDPATFADAVDVGLEGDQHEGMASAVLYLNSVLRDPVEGGVLVVFLSDEDDWSGYRPTDLAEELLEVSERHAVLGLVSGDPTCYGATQPGLAYLEAVDLIGGVHEEVCAPDYLPALQEIMDWI